MLLQHWSISSSSAFHTSWALTHSGKHQSLIFQKPIRLRKPKKKSAPICTKAQLLDEIALLAHNKVLVAAGVSGAIGQLSKPFTNVILYRKEYVFFKSLIQAGGFPSSHSSATVATAVTLGLERGLSDSIFGLAVVYAGIVMYDAQGVRRECGKHASVLNKTLLQNTSVNSFSSKDRISRGSSSLQLDSLAKSSSSKATNAIASPTQTQIKSSDSEEGLESHSSTPLKEIIGHTEVEVTAGAFLGFLVGLVVYNIL